MDNCLSKPVTLDIIKQTLAVYAARVRKERQGIGQGSGGGLARIAQRYPGRQRYSLSVALRETEER
jgi:hypothetical protein